MPTANETYWSDALRGQGEIKSTPRVFARSLREAATQGTIDVDAALDALGRGLAAAGRGMGIDKGWAANRANDAVSSLKSAEDLIGVRTAQRAGRNVVAGRGNWEDALDLALVPGIDALAARYAVKPALRAVARVVRPAVEAAPRPVRRAVGKTKAYVTDPRHIKGASRTRPSDPTPNAPGVTPREKAANRINAIPVPRFQPVNPGSAHATKEVGPYLHVRRTGAQPVIVPEAVGASLDEQRALLRNPMINQPARIAKEYTRENLGRDYDVTFPEPGTSLRKQSAIGRAYQMAAEDAPGYKQALYERYGQTYPQVVEAAGAQNYDQLTEAAYRQLAKETDRQFGTLPVEMRYHYGEGEYAKPSDMLSDLIGRGKLNVFRGGDPHPYLSDIDPDTGLTGNEKFRAVHDYFGHGTRGTTFRPGGEEVAYASHSQMMSPLARMAMAAETRGQNSLVNYSPLNAELTLDMNRVRADIDELKQMDSMRGKPGASAEEIAVLNAKLRELGAGTRFAPQLPLLLPPEHLPADTAGGMPDWLQAISRPTAPSAPERAVHLSHTPGITMTDPKYYGTGHRGDDWARRGDAGSPANKTSFYLGDPGTVNPESLVAQQAPYAYETQLSGLYDISKDPEQLVKLARAHNLTKARMGREGAHVPDLTRLVKEYGYLGYRNPDFLPGQAAAEVFDPVGGLRPIERGPGGYAEGGYVE